MPVSLINTKMMSSMKKVATGMRATALHGKAYLWWLSTFMSKSWDELKELSRNDVRHTAAAVFTNVPQHGP